MNSNVNYFGNTLLNGFPIQMQFPFKDYNNEFNHYAYQRRRDLLNMQHAFQQLQCRERAVREQITRLSNAMLLSTRMNPYAMQRQRALADELNKIQREQQRLESEVLADVNAARFGITENTLHGGDCDPGRVRHAEPLTAQKLLDEFASLANDFVTKVNNIDIASISLQEINVIEEEYTAKLNAILEKFAALEVDFTENELNEYDDLERRHSSALDAFNEKYEQYVTKLENDFEGVKGELEQITMDGTTFQGQEEEILDFETAENYNEFEDLYARLGKIKDEYDDIDQTLINVEKKREIDKFFEDTTKQRSTIDTEKMKKLQLFKELLERKKQLNDGKKDFETIYKDMQTLIENYDKLVQEEDKAPLAEQIKAKIIDWENLKTKYNENYEYIKVAEVTLPVEDQTIINEDLLSFNKAFELKRRQVNKWKKDFKVQVSTNNRLPFKQHGAQYTASSSRQAMDEDY